MDVLPVNDNEPQNVSISKHDHSQEVGSRNENGDDLLSPGSITKRSSILEKHSQGREGTGDLEDEKNDMMDDGDGLSKHQTSARETDKMRLYEEMEAEIIKFCKDNNCLWEDKEFTAGTTCLYKDPGRIPEELKEFKNLKWLRPREIAKDAKMTIDGKAEGDVKQGAVGVTWFLGALIQISTKPHLMEKIFVDTEHFDMGFVSFQFFKNGEWRQIIIDTVLPYDADSKQLLFAQCADPNEFWVPLVEKAYAKMHGGYEHILHGHMTDALVDLTGGTCEKWDLKNPDTKAIIDNGQLWDRLLNAYNQKFVIGCINAVKGKSPKNPDVGPHGILDNHAYGIIDVREFKTEDLKLIRIRNPWGQDGCWNGPFSVDSEEWDKYRHLRDELKIVTKSKQSDGTWWMSFQHFCEFLSKFYICKVFPESWQIFSIDSQWKGKSAGGPSYKMEKLEVANLDKNRIVKADTDDRWFNNPQFKIRVSKETKLYITLMQEDKILSANNYIRVNFMVVVNRDPRTRIWERPEDSDILIDTTTTVTRNNKREITQVINLKRFEGKKYGYYVIVPNNDVETRKDEQRQFWLRLFASEQIDVMEVPETLEKVMEGAWTDETAGGMRKTKEGKDNPNWCRNSQYFLNLSKPTHLKIILRKIGAMKKTKGVKVGLCVCRFDVYNQNQKKLLPPQKKGSTFASATEKLMAQTAFQLEPPIMDHIERKLNILANEKYIESSFISDEVAALYFYWNPTEGPFIVIPCLEEEDKLANYKLTIFSNNKVDLQKLDETKNAVLIGKWDDLTDGGCHLYEDPFEKESQKRTWTSNPKFLLQFKNDTQPTKFKVTLQIAEKNWKAKIAKNNKNTVGGMVGIYVLEKKEGKIQLQQMLKEPSFVPMMEISEELTLQSVNKNGYIIMPTTYESKIRGAFIIAISSDQAFTFEALK